MRVLDEIKEEMLRLAEMVLNVGVPHRGAKIVVEQEGGYRFLIRRKDTIIKELDFKEFLETLTDIALTKEAQ